MYIIYFIQFHYYLFIKYLYGKYGNILVSIHYRYSNTRSTESSINESFLEEIRFRQRKVEQIRWHYWMKMVNVGRKIGIIKNEYQELAESTLKEYQQTGNTDDNKI